MANTKNPAILWNVDQSPEGSDIGKSARDLAQKNIGVKGLVQSATDHKFVTNISQNSTTGNMEIHVGQPTISDIGSLTDNPSQSIVTDANGAMTAASMLYDSANGSTPDDTFVIDRVQQTSQGQVSASGKSLGTAATKNVPASGNAAATEVVMGNDTRLTDARTPVSHADTTNQYGAGSSTHYGHVKLYNNVTGENTDGAPDQKSVHDALGSINDDIGDINDDIGDINDDINDIKDTLETINTFRKITVDGNDFLDSTDTTKLDLYGSSNITLTPNTSTGRVSIAVSGLMAGTYFPYRSSTTTLSQLDFDASNSLGNGYYAVLANNTNNAGTSLGYLYTAAPPNAGGTDSTYFLSTNSNGSVAWQEFYKLPGWKRSPGDSDPKAGTVLTLKAHAVGDNNVYPEWVALPAAAELRSVSVMSQTPYTDIENIISDGDTPMLTLDVPMSYGSKVYYLPSEKQGGQTQSNYVFTGIKKLSNSSVQFNFYEVDGTETCQSSAVILSQAGTLVPTGDSKTPIYIDTNSIPQECAKVAFSNNGETYGDQSTFYTVTVAPGERGNSAALMVRRYYGEIGASTGIVSESSMSSTAATTEALVLHKKLGNNTSYGVMSAFTMSNNDNAYGGASGMIRHVSTALHSVYDGSVSGKPEVPVNRVTLIGTADETADYSKLGNLSVGSLAMRMVDAGDTSESHPLMPSQAAGELTVVKMGTGTAYIKDNSNSTAYIGYDDSDGYLLVTSKSRTLSDAAGRTASTDNAALGKFIKFPSQAYVNKVESDIYTRIDVVNDRVDRVHLSGISNWISASTADVQTFVAKEYVSVQANGDASVNLKPSGSTMRGYLLNGGFVGVSVTSKTNGNECILAVQYRKTGQSNWNNLWRWTESDSVRYDLYSTSTIVPYLGNLGDFQLAIHNYAGDSRDYMITISYIPLTMMTI